MATQPPVCDEQTGGLLYAPARRFTAGAIVMCVTVLRADTS